MPIYSYRCESCGHAKDVLQKVSDPLLTTCPVCGAEAFKKQVTAAGFQLKGSGWYVTDFKGGAAKPAKEPAEAAKSDAAGGAATTPGDAPKPGSGETPAAAPAAAGDKAAAPAAGVDKTAAPPAPGGAGSAPSSS